MPTTCRASTKRPPSPQHADAAGQRGKAERIIRDVRSTGRTILTEYESKQLLNAYGIPTVETRVAITEDEAVEAANEIGYPVVLKLYSRTITHKTDVGGVKLNLATPKPCDGAFRDIKPRSREKAGAEHFLGVTVQPMVKLEGYELILGSSVDPQFGPVLLFGTGGQLVEVFKDRALALPPLNYHSRAAHDGADQNLHRAEGRARAQAGGPGGAGRPAGALQPAGGRAALDQGNRHQSVAGLAGSPARARCPRGGARSGNGRGAALPKPAIRPYPIHMSATWTMKDGNAGDHPPDPPGG